MTASASKIATRRSKRALRPLRRLTGLDLHKPCQIDLVNERIALGSQYRLDELDRLGVREDARKLTHRECYEAWKRAHPRAGKNTHEERAAQADRNDAQLDLFIVLKGGVK